MRKIFFLFKIEIKHRFNWKLKIKMDGLNKSLLKVIIYNLICFHLTSIYFSFFNFKIIIVSCLMREGLSQTVDITCMPSVTACVTLYHDIIICKWEINGDDHYDTQIQANKNCKTIHSSYALWSAERISLYITTPTNDQAMLTKYTGSSAGARLLSF